MKNGRGDHWGDDPKITSIDAARRKVRREQSAQRRSSWQMSVRDWLVGGVVVAMAAAMLVAWTAPVWRSVLGLGR